MRLPVDHLEIRGLENSEVSAGSVTGANCHGHPLNRGRARNVKCYNQHELKLFRLREIPMRRVLALMFAVLALSIVSPAIACPQGSHPCGPTCCPGG